MGDSSVMCIGGGPASFFAAIHAKLKDPGREVSIVEGSSRVLTKVRISGGGRCNVTHHLFDLRSFANCYPRGAREILGPLHHFGPQDTIDWFRARGVRLVPEPDGRMFPDTNTSQTIIECLHHEARKLGIAIRKGFLIKSVRKDENGRFCLDARTETLKCGRLFLGTGSMPTGHRLVQGLGHTITELAPSLFTFCVQHPFFNELAGVSFPHVNLELKVGKRTFKQSGPLLITHWGLSGPAVLKLSAFAARALCAHQYRAELKIDFIPDVSEEELRQEFMSLKALFGKKLVANAGFRRLPTRFWKQFADHLVPGCTWNAAHHKTLENLSFNLKHGAVQVDGKGVFKEEFVTCGGVALQEVNFKTMESKICSGLFLGGEILDIDGITGGFNFQNAWTSGYLAGNHM